MGLSAWQRLRDVELPLAAPAILAGVRVSVTIAIGTATIGSTVGALTLGTPIFDGLAGNKLPFVIQGAVLVALFAIVTDMLFTQLDAASARRNRIPGGGRIQSAITERLSRIRSLRSGSPRAVSAVAVRFAPPLATPTIAGRSRRSCRT